MKKDYDECIRQKLVKLCAPFKKRKKEKHWQQYHASTFGEGRNPNTETHLHSFHATRFIKEYFNKEQTQEHGGHSNHFTGKPWGVPE